jgi:benzoate-CoA ligase family protein|nr:benzoate-CoA ligase family protein [Kofleriaceae bacterium]
MELPRGYNVAADLLERHVAAGRGERVAVIDDDGRHTYRWLEDRVRRAAAVLADLGVQPEQRVALCMVDSVEMIATFLGAIALGAVPVPLNTMLVTDDYRYLLADMRARAIVVSDTLAGKLAPALAGTPALATGAVAVARSPLGGDASAIARHVRWTHLVDATAPRAGYAATTRDDIAFWLYSSGSTGKPKGAMHLQSSPAYTADVYARGILAMSPDDVVFSAAKLFFAYGLGNSLTFPLSVGATALLMAERPTPAAVLRTFATHRPTIFCGVPTLFASLLADPSLAHQDALRVSTSAGEALPRHVGERWRERVGSDILDGIGSTEMLHIFLSNRSGDVAYGTTGRAVPGYDLELRGDDGTAVADGEEGSLWVRGPSACVGYWNDRARSLATFHGSWTRTGDRYVRDADGRWTYSGRADDMLKVGGIWVSPFEVESALSSHPAVLEAAVVGHDDADGLTKPKAFVVLAAGAHATPAELQAHVKGTLAPFKYPRWVDIVSELPKTATGKIQRFKLRAR